MSVVDEIKQRLDIVDVIGAYVPLQKAGRNYKALCPFHTEKTPSFIVFPETQGWHCFGACSTGGDIFTFVMRQENMDFSEALRFLADKAGVPLHPLDEAERERRDKLDRLRDINRLAAEFYHHVLVHTSQGEPGRRYLEVRGLTEQTMATFQLGYAPDDWHALDAHLQREHVDPADALAAGLLSESEKGRIYDRFRGRVIFPIRDPRGRVIGFGGRVLDDSVPKYLNTPQTPLFNKSSVLYGIDLARSSIRESGVAVVVEGYMDVVVPYQYGVTNLVACLGTALTEDHIDILKRITDKLVLALDPDEAGMAAVEKGVETARDALPHHVVPVPTARGLIRYEERLDAEIRVLTLPDGLDPDELILTDRDRWDRLVDQALPVADHFFQLVLDGADLATAKGKRQVVDRLLPVIAAMDSPVERSHYIQRLALAVRVDERQLQRELDRLRGVGDRRRRRPPRRRAAPPRQDEEAASSMELAPTLDLEDRAMTLLVQNPTLIEQVGERFGLVPEAFQKPQNRQVFEMLKELCREQPDARASDLVGLLDTELKSHVESLRGRLRSGPPLSSDLAREDLFKCAARLQKSYLLRLLQELRFVQQDAQEQGQTDRVRELNETIERLRRDYLHVDHRAYAATLVGRSRRGFSI